MDNENEVKDVDTKTLPPEDNIKDDEEIVDDGKKDTSTPSSEEKKPDQEEPKSKEKTEDKEELRGRQSKDETTAEGAPEIKDVEGETPRERALRLEVTRLKRMQKSKMSEGMFKDSPEIEKKDTDPEKKKILDKYNQDELNNLKEVLNVMADDLGFVKKDEYQKSTYQSQSKNILDDFLDSHPEYLPENDKDNILWNRFQEEFSMYRPPQNPKDYKRIFDKIHKEIFNVSSEDSLKKVNAEKEKIKSVSHNSNSSDTTQNKQKSSTPALDPSLKRYMKGFEEGELDELFGE